MIPIEGAFADIDLIQIIMETKRDALKTQYDGIALEEVAAINSVTLLYIEMDKGQTGASKNSEGKDCIVINPSLRQEDKSRMFYTWLAVILAERNGL